MGDHEYDEDDGYEQDPSGSSSSLNAGGGETDATGKRKRITQACDTCNRKKIKCDGAKPTCANCSKSMIPCSYSRGARKRGPRAGYIESLENRLREMEALLRPLQSEQGVVEQVAKNMDVWPMLDKDLPQSTTRPLPPDMMDVASNSGSSETSPAMSTAGGSFLPAANLRPPVPTISTSHFQQQQHTSHPSSGISGGFNSAPSFSTGLPPSASSGQHSAPIPNTSSFQPPRPFHSSSQNIPQEAVSELLDLYFHYIYPFIPLVHKNTFMANFANESPLLLNAMYSLAARYSEHPSIKVNPDSLYNAGDVFYIKARELVDHYMDMPTPSTVSALLLLATYAAGSGRGSAAWMYSGMAIRMAQELKLNIEPEFEDSFAGDARMSWLEKETRRRLWWTCFILDRYAGAAADRSMIINEKDCKVYLPCQENLWCSVSSCSEEPKEAVPVNDPFQITVLTSTNAFTPGIPQQTSIGYFVLLTKIFGKVVEYSNLFKPNTKQQGASSAMSGMNGGPVTAGAVLAPNPADKDYQLSILDASLRSWFSALPESMRNLGVEFAWDLGSESPPSWQVPYLHIFYHTCLILLHRPKMMSSLRDTPQSVQYTPSFSVCQSSATEIASVIRKVSATNPSFYYFTPFVAFCIFQSGLIHVMSNQVCTESVVVEAARRNAEVHVKALQGIARYWFMAGRLFAVLKNLMDSSNGGPVTITTGSDSAAAA
ncbi:hypothetical protein HDV05_005075, partial [Chytridiales sp. JEL 0842]